MVDKERVDVAVAALPTRVPAGLVTRVLPGRKLISPLIQALWPATEGRPQS
jgi:hypothetical protein